MQILIFYILHKLNKKKANTHAVIDSYDPIKQSNLLVLIRKRRCLLFTSSNLYQNYVLRKLKFSNTKIHTNDRHFRVADHSFSIWKTRVWCSFYVMPLISLYKIECGFLFLWKFHFSFSFDVLLSLMDNDRQFSDTILIRNLFHF